MHPWYFNFDLTDVSIWRSVQWQCSECLCFFLIGQNSRFIFQWYNWHSTKTGSTSAKSKIRLLVNKQNKWKTRITNKSIQIWIHNSNTFLGTTISLTLCLPDQICNSPYFQPYNSYNVRSENLVLDQPIIPKLIFFFHHLSGWYCIDIVRGNSILVTHGS